MNKVIAALRKIRLGQLFMVFVAGVFLLVSTACSSVQAKSPAPGADVRNPRTEVPGGTATSRDPNVINTYKGGMNDFNDLDSRANDSGKSIGGKAGALKENAEQNIKKENALKQSVEDTKSKAQSTADDVVKGTKQAAQDAKDKTLGATRDVTKSASRTAEDVKANAKGTASDLDKNLSRTADSVKADAKDTGNNVVDKAQQALENAGDFVKGKLNQAGDNAEKAADTTARNLK